MVLHRLRYKYVFSHVLTLDHAQWPQYIFYHLCVECFVTKSRIFHILYTYKLHILRFFFCIFSWTFNKDEFNSDYKFSATTFLIACAYFVSTGRFFIGRIFNSVSSVSSLVLITSSFWCWYCAGAHYLAELDTNCLMFLSFLRLDYSCWDGLIGLSWLEIMSVPLLSKPYTSIVLNLIIWKLYFDLNQKILSQ